MRSAPRACLAAAVAALAACAVPAGDAERWRGAGERAEEPPARNVILFVGDGMGLTTIDAARILEGQRRGEPGEENWLAFERLPHVALLKTYNTNQQTPDSAGTATALLTGVKTRAGVIGLDGSVARGEPNPPRERWLPTLFEQAEDRGLATGIVTTSRITHATPAAAYAHVSERDWESDAELSDAARAAQQPDIARQLVEFAHGDGIDVVMGGGRRAFLPVGARDGEYPESDGGERRDGRDLLAEWRERHPEGRTAERRAELDALPAARTPKLFALFEPSHMRFESERAKDPGGEPSLAEMTVKALEILSRHPAGFVLLVEGGRIDHAHHLANAYRALDETIAFSDAVAAALARSDPQETLVIVTADHGHTLTIGGYATRGNPILGKVRENDARGAPEPELARDALGLPYTTLGYQNGPGYTGARADQPEGPKRVARAPSGWRGIENGRPDLARVDTADPDYTQEGGVPLASETHSGEDVPAYAGGAGSQRIHGVQEQSYVYHAVVQALGWAVR